MPTLPSCSLPTGRGGLLLGSLPLPSYPRAPGPYTSEMCCKVAALESGIEETIDEIELIVDYAHTVNQPIEEARAVHHVHTCASFGLGSFHSLSIGPGISSGRYLIDVKASVMGVAILIQLLTGLGGSKQIGRASSQHRDSENLSARSSRIGKSAKSLLALCGIFAKRSIRISWPRFIIIPLLTVRWVYLHPVSFVLHSLTRLN